jgi:hypothetical protein
MTDVVRERRQARAPLHFRRIELKYVLPERRVTELVDRISPYVEWDPFLRARDAHSYPITSLYFDSIDLQSLFAKEAGWLSRRRIRLRTYAQTFAPGATAYLEIKRRHDFLVSKDRFPLTVTDAMLDDPRSPATLRRVFASAREQQHPAADEVMVMDAWFNLQPTALVTYDRIAFVARADPTLRLTVDRDLQGVWKPWSVTGDEVRRRCGIHPVLPRLMSYGTRQAPGPNPLRTNEHVIVELKFAHGIPAWTHQVIQTMNLERSAYSKYAVVVRSLLPNLFETHEDE